MISILFLFHGDNWTILAAIGYWIVICGAPLAAIIFAARFLWRKLRG